MPVAAGVVGDGRVRAGVVLAARDMAAERDRGRGRYPRPPELAGPRWRRLRRRFGPMPLPRPLVCAAKLRERTLDGGDPSCRHTCVARRRVQLGMPKQSLDQPDIGATLEQMRGKAVAQRMQTDALPDAGRVRRLMEQAAELARR